MRIERNSDYPLQDVQEWSLPSALPTAPLGVAAGPRTEPRQRLAIEDFRRHLRLSVQFRDVPSHVRVHAGWRLRHLPLGRQGLLPDDSGVLRMSGAVPGGRVQLLRLLQRHSGLLRLLLRDGFAALTRRKSGNEKGSADTAEPFPALQALC